MYIAVYATLNAGGDWSRGAVVSTTMGGRDVCGNRRATERRFCKYRVCFRWEDGYADEVEVTDYHA
jgi:hypothetical protein